MLSQCMSRFVSRRILSSASILRNVAAPSTTFRSSFHTSSNIRQQQQQSSPPSAPSSSDVSSLLSRYGWWPAGGLAAAAALSKEILILDEEVLVLATFSITVYALYSQFGDAVASFLDERAKKIQDEMSTVMDATSVSLDEEVKSSTEMLTLADDVNALYTHQMELLDRYVAALPNQLRAEMSSQITKRLSLIAERERNVVDSMQQALADSSAEHVRNIFTESSADEKTKLILNAVKMIGSSNSSSKDVPDPVRDEFVKYFSSFSARIKKDEGKKIELDEKQKAAWNESLVELKRRDPGIKDVDASAPSSVTL